MDIKEIKQEKDRLARDIAKLIDGFEVATGTTVTDIDLHHVRALGEKGTVLLVAHVEILVEV